MSFTFDHASGWFVGAENQEDSSTAEYGGGVMFNVAPKGGSDGGDSGGGSGCNAGFGSSPLMGLPLLLASFLGRKRG
ncbi:MAG: hypothetical protein LBS75_09260 [Synergistaceae bacterium]|nr:hypothetical protein [Synergistaceae bacterium]